MFDKKNVCLCLLNHLDFIFISTLSCFSHTGYGGLSLSIEGPSKVDINTEDQEDGTCKVTY